MNKDKLFKLYMVVGQIQELLEDGFVSAARKS